MKKVLLMLAAVGAVASFSACKKSVKKEKKAKVAKKVTHKEMAGYSNKRMFE